MKKPIEEAKSCSECEHLADDKGTWRCLYFYRAIIEDVADKHCEDSIH